MYQVPEGWEEKPFKGYKDLVEISAPDKAGFVTVDFGKREFRAGYTVHGKADSTKAYAGRGWRDELRSDAVAWLANIVREIKDRHRKPAAAA